MLYKSKFLLVLHHLENLVDELDKERNEEGAILARLFGQMRKGRSGHVTVLQWSALSSGICRYKTSFEAMRRENNDFVY